MRTGLFLAYWPWFSFAEQIELARMADDLRLDSVWVSEAWGQDAATVLAHLSAVTEHVDLGSGLFQIPARSPAMTAMTAATLDVISGGRFRLGLGVSGPQVSEGWHGVRFGSPLGRTEEYVAIVRKALARERVEFHGKHYELPLPDGPGKAIKLTVHPVREHIPVYLAAIGPKNLELAGRIADGWLPLFFAPEHASQLLEPVRTGRAAAGHTGDDALDGFDIAPTVPTRIDADVEAAAAPIRAYAALYIGGMGSRDKNFYNALAVRMGFEQEAQQVQDLYLGKQYAEAAAAVPRDFIDQTSLIGPPERIRDRLQAYADSGVTTLTVSPFGATLEERTQILRTIAEQLDAAGLAQ